MKHFNFKDIILDGEINYFPLDFKIKDTLDLGNNECQSTIIFQFRESNAWCYNDSRFI